LEIFPAIFPVNIGMGSIPGQTCGLKRMAEIGVGFGGIVMQCLSSIKFFGFAIRSSLGLRSIFIAGRTAKSADA
jgi:hypothetical protein